jgi:hypothetical protein
LIGFDTLITLRLLYRDEGVLWRRL